MLLTKLILLINLGSYASMIINGESSVRSDTFKGSFSLKTNLEIYEGTKLQKITETHERYLQSEKRSTIQAKTTQIRLNSIDQTKREVTYYYDGIYKLWLQYNDRHCSESNAATFVKHLFNEDIFEIWLQDGVEAEIDGHIVGVAKLLPIIEKLKPDFKRAEFRVVRNLEAVVFKGSLESQNIAYSSLRYEIIYNKAEMSKIFDSDVLPLHLILNYDWPQETSMIIIHFYGLERINNMLDTDFKSVDFLLLPPASNCGNSIKNIVTQELLERTQKSLSSVSFNAKFVSSEAENDEDMALENNIDIFYAFNREAKLMRRDRMTYGTHLELLSISSTFYDFKQNKKYNVLKNYRSLERTFDEMSSFEGPNNYQETSKCVSSDISRQFDQNYHQFIKLDKLKYLGRTQVRGILANVFEDDSIDVPPYWLFPSVLVKLNDKQAIEASEFDQIVGPTGVLILVYYFAPGLAQEMPIGKLLKIDIMVKDNLRKILTITKEIHLFDFLSGNSHRRERAISSQTNLFSLSRVCFSNSDSDSGMFADIAVLFEPKEDNFNREDLALSAERLFQKEDREELILQALFNNFQLSRLYIDQLETKLAKSKRDQRNFFANRWHLPIIKLEMRVKNFESTSIDCILLGRGRFLDQSAVSRAQVLTFEECLWFAKHHSKAISKEVVFAYHQTKTKKHINECLIDPLYSSNARTNYTQTLGYYPYEYGEYMMYKIQVNSQDPHNKMNGTQFTSWPIIRSGANYLIGQQISLPKIDKDKDLELVYVFMQVEVSGQLYKREEQLKPGEQIHGIGWIQQQTNQSRNQPLIKTIKAPSTKTISTQDVGIMTKDLCQSMCLLDLECKSYSYCKNLGLKRACSVSNIDLQLEDNAKSLKDAANSILTNQKDSQLISIDDIDGLRKTIEVRLDRKCSIFSKSYSNLFRKDHPVYVNLRANMDDIIQVVDENECARHCYEQNLSFLRGIIKQELDIKMIHEDLEELRNSNENDSTRVVGKLESILDWHTKNVKNLCTTFQYADILPNGNGTNATYACIISRNHQKRDTSLTNQLNPPQQLTKMTTMSRYKLIEMSFYEKMPGFRFLDYTSSDEQTIRAEFNSNNTSVSGYVNLLSIHHQGLNKQILLNMDNVEFCARACLLQTQGPKPSCASFDYVQEHNNSSRRQYCLLNSQSLHSLKRRRKVENQLLFAEKNVQYWHFEPRESLIIPTDMEDDDKLIQILAGDSLVKQFDEPTRCKVARIEFDVLSFIIAILGIVSGSLMGIKLAKSVIRNRDAEEEMKYGSRMVRLVHRLSGLSIDGRHLQNEVRM